MAVRGPYLAEGWRRLRHGGRSNLRTVALLAGVVLVAANLRPAITVVGPLIEVIREDTGLSASAAGLVTTIPILGFGVASVSAAWLARRFGLRRCMAYATAVLTLGILIRIVPGTELLLIGTVVLGLGLTMANVLLPAVVKLSFPQSLALMTALYGGVMGMAAALGSGVAVPLADALPGGWRGALGIWAIPAALAAVIWALQREPGLEVATEPPTIVRGGRVWRAPTAWWVTAFFGFQAAGFLVSITWLPAILVDFGLSAARAGAMVFLLQVAGVVGVIGIPHLAGRTPDQVRLSIAISGCAAAGILGLIVTGGSAVAVWIVILGFAQGASLGLGLMFVVLRTRDADGASELSGMAQGLGYSVAATAPVLAGAAFDVTGSWDSTLALLLALAAAQIAAAWRAGRPGPQIG